MPNITRPTAVVLSTCVNALGVARCLGGHGIPVIVVATHGYAPGAYSQYVRDVWQWSPDTEELVDMLVRQHNAHDVRPVLFPCSDGMVRALARRHDYLALHYRINLPTHSLVDELMSKRGFAKLAAQCGLPVPRTVFVDTASQITDIAGVMSYPCIVKPDYHNAEQSLVQGLKTARAQNADELRHAYHNFSEIMPRAVIQEWIPGGDSDVFFCLQYYNDESRPLVSFCGRKIRQWPPLCGSTASCEPVACSEMLELNSRCFSALGFQGLCSMEYKRDPRSGRFLMIEPTIGRTDYQSAIANVNGVPIPYVAYCDLAGLPQPSWRQKSRRVKWVRWSADKASAAYYRTEGKLGFWAWLWSIRPPVAWSTWAWNDPMPWLKTDCKEWIRRGVRKMGRLLGRFAGTKASGSPRR